MILRVCVVIPTYNNPTTVTDVVKDVVLKTRYPILIVDDGSNTPVEDVLYSWDVRKAIESGRVRVVRFPENRGKGAALAFAIRDLVRHGFTHMLTIDADGQHLASEIDKLTAVAKTHPWDLIIGHRRFRGESVPAASKFGRKFSNFWVAYQTGLTVRDSQSGFRLYPLFTVQNFSFFTRKFDFEIEVLIRLIWRGIHVQEVDIDVIYQPPGERVSHFHKFWDNARISILNTALVTISLLKGRKSPLLTAISAGVGVFVGCTPFFGFHTLIVAALAFVFRLNAVALWLGSQISIPPLAPLLILASIFIGGQWLGIKLGTGAIPHFQQWLAGSLVLGAALGTVTTVVTYFTALAFRARRSRSSNWNGRARGGRFGNGFLLVVLRHLGIRAGYFCLYFIVPYFYVFAPKGRRGLNEYYSLAKPELGFLRRQREILRHFFRYGQVLMDRVYQGYAKDLVFTVNTYGREHIMRQLENGQGVLMLGGHLGGWDLSSSLLSIQGLKDKVYRVEHEPVGYSYYGMTKSMRQDLVSVDSKSDSNAIFVIHQALSLGRCVALMGDRPIADRFELVPFLGRLAPFDVTAFRLAAATRVPLLFTFGFKGRGMEYDFYAGKPRTYEYAPGVPREIQLYAWVEQFVREIEKFIAQYPDQWFNYYTFWSSVPTAPDGSPSRSAGHCLLEELPLPANLEVGWGSVPKTDDGPQLTQ